MPSEVSLEEAQQAARNTALSMLSNIKRELGDLDWVMAWLIVHGMVNAEPGYPQTTNAINGFSDLILEAYGDLKLVSMPGPQWGWLRCPLTMP